MEMGGEVESIVYLSLTKRLHPLVCKNKESSHFRLFEAPRPIFFLLPFCSFQACCFCRMRPAMPVPFLLLLLLLAASTVQGIRLGGESLGAFQKKVQEDNRSITGGVSSDRGTALCKEDGQCSGRSSRKLLPEAKAEPKSTRSEGTEADSSQRLRPEEEAAGHPVKSAGSEHKKSATETTYPDLMDIAGMDYSPAVRKPPIHN